MNKFFALCLLFVAVTFVLVIVMGDQLDFLNNGDLYYTLKAFANG